MNSQLFAFDTYKKSFKKLMDYFDPEEDKFLLTESLFRDLYNLRESHAIKADVCPTTIISDADLISHSKLVVDKYRDKMDEPRLRSMLPLPMYVN